VVPGILQKIHPSNQVRPEGREPIFGVMFGGDFPNNGGGENITVEYTMPPNKQVVYYIIRQVTYRQAISRDNFIGALRQKYGHETMDSFNGSPYMWWMFDEQGRAVSAEKNTNKDSPFGCYIPVTPGGGWFVRQVNSYLRGELPPATFCDSIILLTVQLTAAPTGPVYGATTAVLESALLRREATAAGEAQKAQIQKQQQQDLKNAQQAKPVL
jgi:hypothetical protein